LSFAFVEQQGVKLLLPDSLSGLTAAFTTRHGGVSNGEYAQLNIGLHVGDDDAAVIENRRRACGALGVTFGNLVVAEQSHGPNVAVVDASFKGRGATSIDDAVPNADALITATPAVPLLIMVADCVPIICWDPGLKTVAAIHAGWRGTVTRVTEVAVQTMVDMGSNPRDIVATIGPAISPSRYQVGPEVVDQANEGLGPEVSSRVIHSDGTGRYLFDLWAANEAVLVESGLSTANITTARIDSGSGDFFSDRLARPCGRFGVIVEIPAK